jgi:DNA mismatch repair protein MLH1
LLLLPQPGPGACKQELCALVETLLAQKAEMLAEYTGLVFTCPSGEASTTARDQEQQQQALCLTGIPLLLDGYVPDLSLIPQLVMQLARDVDWESEKECFKSLAKVVAWFYGLHPLLSLQQQQLQQQCQEKENVSKALQLRARTAGVDGVSVSDPTSIDVADDAQPMEVDDQGCPSKAKGSSDGKQQAGPSSPPATAGVMGQHRDQQQREWLLRHVLMPAIKYMYKPPQERARDGSVLLLTSMQKLYRVFERCGW